MEFTAKEAARRIRIHNKIHQRAEPRNSPIITEILEVAAVLFEKIDTEEYQLVKHGRWIVEKGSGEYAVCSECGGKSGTQWDGVEPIPLMTQYCPHCGAEMEVNK